jgi:hypothetical protein
MNNRRIIYIPAESGIHHLDALSAGFIAGHFQAPSVVSRERHMARQKKNISAAMASYPDYAKSLLSPRGRRSRCVLQGHGASLIQR